jgi:CheY-like chemotaxis protein
LTQLPAIIKTDERKLRQILLNLLGNAVKFTDRGCVSFRVAAENLGASHARLRFDVADTGIGIVAAEVERIFDPFHQVRERNRPIEGTGLGLAISQRLVSLLGGKLTVVSTPAQGSTFSVEIDVELGEAVATRTTHAALAIVGYNGRRRRILVADDNRQILGRLLQTLGFEVDEADNGARAVALALARTPDLIFMDLVMPVKDGFEAMRELRAKGGEIARVPIVAVSASAFDSTRTDSLQAGCDEFIAKPVRLDEVTDVIARLLRLEWTRGPLRASSANGKRNGDGRHGRLPQPLASELYELALQGDVHALTHKLSEASAEGIDSGLLAELTMLAGSYDMKALREFLRQHAEAAK